MDDTTPKTQTPEFSLVEEIHGWTPTLPAKAHVDISEAGQSGCILCSAEADVHARVWEAYGESKDRQAALRVSRRHGLEGLEAKLIGNHFANHTYQQPQPREKKNAAKLLQDSRRLPEDSQRLITTVARQGVLSNKQLVQLFAQPHNKNYDSAKASMSRRLHKLSYNHMLVGVRQAEQKSAEKFFTLGEYAKPLAAHRDDVTESSLLDLGGAHTYGLERIAEAADVFVQLRSQLYGKRGAGLTAAGKRANPHMPTEAWWGSHDLRLEYRDGKKRKTFVPDGFCTLRVNDGLYRQLQMPIFFIKDNGDLSCAQIADQLLAYRKLAGQGVIEQRFPQLDVEGYVPPMLLVCQNQLRLQRISMILRNEMDNLEEQSVEPALLATDLRKLNEDAWGDDAWVNLMEGSTYGLNLIEQIIEASDELVESGNMHYNTVVRINRHGARPRVPGLPGWMS